MCELNSSPPEAVLVRSIAVTNNETGRTTGTKRTALNSNKTHFGLQIFSWRPFLTQLSKDVTWWHHRLMLREAVVSSSLG